MKVICVRIVKYTSSFTVQGNGGGVQSLVLSQLRSLLPSGTPVVALTATATRRVKDSIVRSLQLAPMELVVLSANRLNIRYSVLKVSRDIHVTFQWLLLELKAKQVTLRKVCLSIKTCASLYKMFITELEESYEPCGSTPSITNRLLACTMPGLSRRTRSGYWSR